MHCSNRLRLSIALLAFLFSGCLSVFSAESDLQPRAKLNLDRDWKFTLGDPSAAVKAGFDDQTWQNVNLPHSFSMPYFLSPQFYTGYGWYRKHLFLPAKGTNRRYNLEFEGVFQVAELYVNGHPVGSHRGGYNGFTIDITEALKAGDNLIAVRVNNLWDARLAPRAGEHVFSGGIYRDVWLVETDALHVTWYGTFVTTPVLSEHVGQVQVSTEIRNEGTTPRKAVLNTRLMAPDGTMVAEMNSEFELQPGQNRELVQTSPEISQPMLWSPENPVLYTAVSQILSGGQVADRYDTPFGMRWTNWTADQGFFLNGKHRYFKGCNVHQDHAGWGDAVTNDGFRRDVRLMKEAGFDFIRGSHYPHDPAFSEACDRQGMLFWSENCFWGIGGFKPEGDWNCSAYPTKVEDEAAFKASVRQSLTEMIRIHRNHPSIIVWSMSNEPFFTVPEKMPNVRTFLRELVQLSHELDPTRAAAIGGCQRGEIDSLGDVAGYNGDGAKLYLNPGFPSVVCEYGSTIADRPGPYTPGYGELQEQAFDWRSGQAIWCGYDHGSIAGHFGCMGIMDYFRLPKRQWYWYRNALTGKAPDPLATKGEAKALRLTADKTLIQPADGTSDVHLTVAVLDAEGLWTSRSPEVTLEIVSGPGEFPTGRTIRFSPQTDIVIRDGMAAIEFRSYQTGKTLIRATSPDLQPAELTIVSEGGPTFKVSTKLVSDRPYHRFENKKPERAASVNILAERPTRVSSSTVGHASKLANDNDTTSYWQPLASEIHTWWQVDMENIYTLKEVRMAFGKAYTGKLVMEVSMDGTDWKSLTKAASNLKNRGNWSDRNLSAVQGRFLRITMDGKPDLRLRDVKAFTVEKR
jgi:hypothetical protein